MSNVRNISFEYLPFYHARAALQILQCKVKGVKHLIKTGVNSLNTFEIELNKVLLKNVLSRTGYIYGLFKIILI